VNQDSLVEKYKINIPAIAAASAVVLTVWLVFIYGLARVIKCLDPDSGYIEFNSDVLMFLGGFGCREALEWVDKCREVHT